MRCGSSYHSRQSADGAVYSVTGVAIPEGQRGSDGIEDFENLLEANYDQHRLQPPRNMRQKSPNTLSRSGAEKDVDDLLDRDYSQFDSVTLTQFMIGSIPRSRTSAMVPPLGRATDVNYAPIPSPRAAGNRLGYTTSPLAPGLWSVPPYDPMNDIHLPARSSQGFGALSRLHDEPVDPDLMLQYVNPEYGQDTPSPAPAVGSPPPQMARKSLGSPTASRSNRKPAAPAPLEDDVPSYSDKPNSSRQAKGKQRATPEEDEDVPINQSSRKTLTGEQYPVREDLEAEAGKAPYSHSSRTPRTYGGGRDREAPPIDEEPLFLDEPQEAPLDSPKKGAGGDYYEEGDDFHPPDEGEFAEPPHSASERGEGESEDEAPPKKTKSKPKIKEKDTVKSKKKRPLEDGAESPVQSKRAKSTSVRPSSRARSKTPVGEESYLEGLFDGLSQISR